jgi:hypothetical protein
MNEVCSGSYLLMLWGRRRPHARSHTSTLTGMLVSLRKKNLCYFYNT